MSDNWTADSYKFPVVSINKKKTIVKKWQTNSSIYICDFQKINQLYLFSSNWQWVNRGVNIFLNHTTWLYFFFLSKTIPMCLLQSGTKIKWKMTSVWYTFLIDFLNRIKFFFIISFFLFLFSVLRRYIYIYIYCLHYVRACIHIFRHIHYLEVVPDNDWLKKTVI